MTTPTLSFVIPTYDAAATLRRAVESVRAQAPASLAEIIVVDDASNDDTLVVARELAAQLPGLTVAKTPSNGGPGIARNLGVDRARGDWIAFLDADDVLVKGAVQALAARCDTDADLVAFDWCYRAPDEDDPRGSHRSQGTAGPRAHEGREDLELLAMGDRSARIRGFLAHRVDPSVIFHAYRRRFVERLGLRFRGGLHEDVDYSFRALAAAHSIATLSQGIYAKWDRPGSIVNTLDGRHIEGYFDAVDEVWRVLDEGGDAAAHRDDFVEFVVNVVGSRIIRVLRRAPPGDERGLLLEALRRRGEQALAGVGVRADAPRAEGKRETKYQKLFARLLRGREAADADGSALLAELAELGRKSWSCFDLAHSVFLAPDEVRTCCKRYFQDGRQKGDVVLLRASDPKAQGFSFEAIAAAKRELVRDINRNAAPQCDGCPFLSFDTWGPPLEEGVRYLSLEYHSVCNMRCTYCSPTYYGGKKPLYDVEAVVESFAAARALERADYVVWGGGEPLLRREFEPLLVRLSELAPQVRQRVITNATTFSPVLAELLSRDRAFIVVSLDAGTEATFCRIRGFRGMDRVLGNVSRYHAAHPKNVILKYILMAGNDTSDELSAFVERMETAGLLTANFQVSCDFRSEVLSDTEIAAVADLAVGLLRKGAGFVFLDDLVWQRFPRFNETSWQKVAGRFGPGAVAAPEAYPKVAVYGTGAQAKLLMEKAWFLQKTEVAYFVDPRPDRVGARFLGRPVRSPEALAEDAVPVVLAAVQSAPFMARDLSSLGLGASRRVSGLVL